MRFEVLGCSGGIGGKLRTTAFLLDDDTLIDGGTGATDLSLSQLAKIDRVFLTHSHLDHIAAIPWILDTVGSAREKPLVVHGLEATIRTLKDHIFNWRVWPDFTKIPTIQRPYLVFEPITVGAEVNLAGKTIQAIPSNHVVPSIGYCVKGTNASLIFSGDTSASDGLWSAANACENLRYLLIETAFANRDKQVADASKHMYPDKLATELQKFTGNADVFITHMKPGEEDNIMTEIEAAVVGRRPKRLLNGQVFEL